MDSILFPEFTIIFSRISSSLTVFQVLLQCQCRSKIVFLCGSNTALCFYNHIQQNLFLSHQLRYLSQVTLLVYFIASFISSRCNISYKLSIFLRSRVFHICQEINRTAKYKQITFFKYIQLHLVCDMIIFVALFKFRQSICSLHRPRLNCNRAVGLCCKLRRNNIVPADY